MRSLGGEAEKSRYFNCWTLLLMILWMNYWKSLDFRFVLRSFYLRPSARNLMPKMRVIGSKLLL